MGPENNTEPEVSSGSRFTKYCSRFETYAERDPALEKSHEPGNRKAGRVANPEAESTRKWDELEFREYEQTNVLTPYV